MDMQNLNLTLMQPNQTKIIYNQQSEQFMQMVQNNTI